MTLRDIPERLLRHIWYHQLFERTGLSTHDGRSVHVLSPGIPNEDAGPDFSGACIRIGDILFRGDVEIHHNPAAWISHRHQMDPHYNSVILHVVLTVRGAERPSFTVSGRPLPLLVLQPFLGEQLIACLEHNPVPHAAAPEPRIPCTPLRPGDVHRLVLPWLETLAGQRLEMRVRTLEGRLMLLADEAHSTMCAPLPEFAGRANRLHGPPPRHAPPDLARGEFWDQLLFEGVMEGMGYAKNQQPFLALARTLTLKRLRDFGFEDIDTLIALLLGTAGLMPSPGTVADTECRSYLVSLHRRWKTLRPLLKIPLLHEGDWLFFRLRPANFPTARLAAMAFLLRQMFTSDTMQAVRAIVTSTAPVAHRIRALMMLLAVRPDNFWEQHLLFIAGSGRGVAIGRSRSLDIITNTLIPLTLLHARTCAQTTGEEEIRELYAHLPAPSPNTFTRIVQRDLLGREFRLHTALLGQGALQLYKHYCLARRCPHCAINGGPGAAAPTSGSECRSVKSFAVSSSPPGRGCCSE
jgi:Protein of unknown function (DUF2851)